MPTYETFSAMPKTATSTRPLWLRIIVGAAHQAIARHAMLISSGFVPGVLMQAMSA